MYFYHSDVKFASAYSRFTVEVCWHLQFATNLLSHGELVKLFIKVNKLDYYDRKVLVYYDIIRREKNIVVPIYADHLLLVFIIILIYSQLLSNIDYINLYYLILIQTRSVATSAK